MQRTGRWIARQSGKWDEENRSASNPFELRWLPNVRIFILPGDAPGGPFASETTLAEVGNLARLGFASLDGTDVTDAGLAKLRGVTNLCRLALEDCPRITDPGLAHLKGLTNLSQLDFCGCPQITDAGLVHLEHLPELAVLDLGRTQVSDAGLLHFKGRTKLKVVCVGGTRVTEAGWKALEAGIPGLWVFR